VPGAIVAEGDIPRSYPFDAGVNTSFGGEHHDYPAADIFARCGTPVFSPVDGVIGFANPTNLYDPATDDPANRGGISVAMIGDDGVRYYMAHFRSIGPDIAEGRRIARGAPVGEVGDTGRASACHLHFAISPACSSLEWWVRRGVIWPQTYLESWREGGNLSPVEAVNAFMDEHPDACTDPAAMPWPSD
jgi:murein DD-endopeptidase MepM/ murein hydrolase activator NlpD